MDNNNPTTPQNQTQPPVQAQQQPQNPSFAPAPQNLAPQAPIDTVKYSKIGWILFVLSVVITAVGLIFGYIVVISAIAAAISARLGLQAKNKVLATISIIFCILILALYTIAKFSS